MPIAVSGSNIVFADGSSIASGFTGFKNKIINGAMTIDQRNAGASVTPTSSTYIVDRFQTILSVASKLSFQQTSTAPVGFSNSLKITSTSAYSLGAADYFQVEQSIEGFNTADLNWGTANAKTVTLSFWVQSSLTGTFGMFFANGANDRRYPATYTISSANTWEYKTITLVGDTTGTWNTTNSTGLRIVWPLGYGSNYTSGTAGAWVNSTSSNFIPAGCVSVVGTNGATFYITGVQLEAGSSATSFEYRDYGNELRMCQRYYYRKSTQIANSDMRYGMGFSGSGSTTTAYIDVTLPVNMRVGPTSVDWTNTIALWAGATNFQVTAISVYTSGAGTTSCLLQCTSSGLTGEKPYQLVGYASGGASLGLSAEL
jgi:hypothetical protein